MNFALAATGTIESKTSCYARLRDDIFSRLAVKHKIPPNIEDDFRNPFPLSFQFLLLGVSKMDEINQVISVDAYVELLWTQKELTWNSSDYGGLEWVIMNSNDLWCPSIAIVMGHAPAVVLGMPFDVQLYSNGTVEANSLDSLSFSCNIDFEKYPFDVQECSVGFLVVDKYPLPLIEIKHITNYMLTPYTNISGEWTFLNVTHEIVRTEPGVADFPRYTFILKRQSMYYVITVIFPMVLTSVMIPLVFLIPAQVGEKMSYLTAIFTSTAVYLNYICDVMPRSLSHMPHLAVLLIEVQAEGFLATLASLLIVNIFQKEEKLSASKVYPKNETSFKDNSGPHTLTDGHHELFSAVKKTSPKVNHAPKITSRTLDIICFYLFSCGQLVILVIIFTAWL